MEILLLSGDRKYTPPAVGDLDLGYYGQIDPANFISGLSLAQQMGVSTSNAVDLSTPWLKFAFKGKILYIAKHPIINFISWQALSNSGVIDGSRNVNVLGNTYKVRLITGVDNNLSEWNNLIYRVHVNDPTGTHWEAFNNADLYVGVGNGRTTWCQEVIDGRYVYRGYASLTDYQLGLASSSTATTGWRPCLELV